MLKKISLILISILTMLSIPLRAQEEITQVPEYESLDKMVDYAKTLERRPYRFGATGPYAFDCSGFTQFCYKKVGITLERNSKQQAEQGKKIRKRKYLKTGDLVCFNGSKIGDEVGHVGIVVENNDGVFTFIHASSSIGITISSSETKYFDERYLQGRRITTDKKIRRALKKYANYVADSTAVAKGEKTADDELEMPDQSTTNSKKKGWWNRIRERRAARKKSKTEQGSTEKSQNSNNSNKQSQKTTNNTSKKNSTNKQSSNATQKTTNNSSKQTTNKQNSNSNNSSATNTTQKTVELTKSEEKKSTTEVKKEDTSTLKQVADTVKTKPTETTAKEVVEKAFKKSAETKKDTVAKDVTADATKVSTPTVTNNTTMPTNTNVANSLTGPLHTVEKGDTLYNIAKRAGCTVQQLRDWNNLTNDALSIGQVIRIKAEK